MDNTKINDLSIQLESLSRYNITKPIPANVVLNSREGITSLSQQVSDMNPSLSIHLIDLKNALFTEMLGCFYINPVVYGQTLEVVGFAERQILVASQKNGKSLCRLLHPDIQRVSEKLYQDGSYAEAACNAFIEINSRIKDLYRRRCPNTENIPDGQPLMNKAFSDNNPVLEAGDRTTQTGRDIHAGTRFLFAGAMAAFRNPKSHENIELEKDNAMRQLVFASMLMFKIDEMVAASEGNC